MTKKVQVELHKILKHYQWKIMTFARWNFISISRTLSEDFIEEFQDKVDWRFISKYQTLSESFIEKYQDKLDIKDLLETNKITKQFYNVLTRPISISRFELLDI